MPLDYQCSQCRFGVSVGTYHYHSHESGYFGRSLIYCKSCGTQHAIEIPMHDESLPYTLRSMPGPAVDCPLLDGIKLLFPKTEWSIPLQIPDADVTMLACQHCGESGTLTERIDDVWTCPHCEASNSGYMALWMT